MSKVDLYNMFGLVPSIREASGKQNLVVDAAVHPMLENPYIKAAMIENDELAIHLVDLLIDGIPTKSGATPRVFRSCDFTADGIAITFKHYNQAAPVSCLVFHLNEGKNGQKSGITLECISTKHTGETFFQFKYNGTSQAAADHVSESVAGEYLGEQIALPGFLSTFRRLRLDRMTRYEPGNEIKVAWDLI